MTTIQSLMKHLLKVHSVLIPEDKVNKISDLPNMDWVCNWSSLLNVLYFIYRNDIYSSWKCFLQTNICQFLKKKFIVFSYKSQWISYITPIYFMNTMSFYIVLFMTQGIFYLLIIFFKVIQIITELHNISFDTRKKEDL